MKVSFDFDGTLARESIQKYAKELVDLGYEVHIVTARYDAIPKYTKEFMHKYQIEDLQRQFDYLFEVADEIGIPRDRIHFTNMISKHFFFEENKGFLWHLDDDRVEIDSINEYTSTVGISCSGQSTWVNKCNRLLTAANE
jgi:hypothetical protein